MKITHVIPYMHPNAGGPPIVVDRFCRELQGRGVDVNVLTTDALAETDNSSWQQQFDHLQNLHVLPSWGNGPFAFSARLAKLLRQLAAESDLVQIHTLWTYPGFMAARICRQLKTPYLVMPHGMLDPHSVSRKSSKKKLIGRLVQWPQLRRSAGMIYTHDEERQLAESTCDGLPPGFIVPLGADTPPSISVEELRGKFFARFPELAKKQLVLFLSRLHSKKGLDLLIPAFQRVVTKHPQAQLVLVGPGEPDYIKELQALAAKAGVANHMTMTGPLYDEDKWGAMAASALFALPSYQENFALVVVDALQLGLPAVLSRRVNIWDNVVSAGAAVDCELNPESIANAICFVLENETFRQEAALAGPRLVQEQFTWQKAADEMLRAYESVLTRTKAEQHSLGATS